jgi:hypothetical protein
MCELHVRDQQSMSAQPVALASRMDSIRWPAFAPRIRALPPGYFTQWACAPLCTSQARPECRPNAQACIRTYTVVNGAVHTLHAFAATSNTHGRCTGIWCCAYTLHTLTLPQGFGLKHINHTPVKSTCAMQYREPARKALPSSHCVYATNFIGWTSGTLCCPRSALPLLPALACIQQPSTLAGLRIREHSVTEVR